jgi:hypothetical protein
VAAGLTALRDRGTDGETNLTTSIPLLCWTSD